MSSVAVFTVSVSKSVVGHCVRQANARPAMSQENANPKLSIDGKTLTTNFISSQKTLVVFAMSGR